MKEYEIQIKRWQNGSGWSYNSTIDYVEFADDIDVQEYVNDYGKDYAEGLNHNDFADGDYVVVAIGEDGNEAESDWLSEFLDEDD